MCVCINIYTYTHIYQYVYIYICLYIYYLSRFLCKYKFMCEIYINMYMHIFSRWWMLEFLGSCLLKRRIQSRDLIECQSSTKFAFYLANRKYKYTPETESWPCEWGAAYQLFNCFFCYAGLFGFLPPTLSLSHHPLNLPWFLPSNLFAHVYIHHLLMSV